LNQDDINKSAPIWSLLKFLNLHLLSKGNVDLSELFLKVLTHNNMNLMLNQQMWHEFCWNPLQFGSFVKKLSHDIMRFLCH
jgi:hypothetical protein